MRLQKSPGYTGYVKNIVCLSSYEQIIQLWSEHNSRDKNQENILEIFDGKNMYIYSRNILATYDLFYIEFLNLVSKYLKEIVN